MLHRFSFYQECEEEISFRLLFLLFFSRVKEINTQKKKKKSNRSTCVNKTEVQTSQTRSSFFSKRQFLLTTRCSSSTFDFRLIWCSAELPTVLPSSSFFSPKNKRINREQYCARLCAYACLYIHTRFTHCTYISFHILTKAMEKKKKEEKRRALAHKRSLRHRPTSLVALTARSRKCLPSSKKKKKKLLRQKKKGRSFLRASQGGAHTPVATRAFPSRSVRMAVCLSFSRPAAASPRFTSPPPPSFFFFSSSLLPSVYRRRRREAETRERHRRERKKENSQPAHERKGDRERENTKDKTAFSAAKIA